MKDHLTETANEVVYKTETYFSRISPLMQVESKNILISTMSWVEFCMKGPLHSDSRQGNPYCTNSPLNMQVWPGSMTHRFQHAHGWSLGPSEPSYHAHHANCHQLITKQPNNSLKRLVSQRSLKWEARWILLKGVFICHMFSCALCDLLMWWMTDLMPV